MDSRQIAEYAYRYSDELRFWQPKDEIIEKIRHLLTAREQFTKQSVALQNSISAYKKHVVQVTLITNAHTHILKELKKQIAEIDKELEQLIRKNPTISNIKNQLTSLPGVGLLLSSSLIAMTARFERLHLTKPWRHSSAYVLINIKVAHPFIGRRTFDPLDRPMQENYLCLPLDRSLRIMPTSKNTIFGNLSKEKL